MFPEPDRGREPGGAGAAPGLTAPSGGGAKRRSMQFFPRLGELRHRTAGLLSGGERQMLAIASALVCRPELLLVDELSLGLAPVVVEDLMRRLIADPPRARHHHPASSSRARPSRCEVADYGYVLENGRIVLDGDAARLRGHPDIQEFYLGQRAAASAAAIATSSNTAAAGGGMAELEVDDLSLRFGGLTVLDGVSFAVRAGRAVRADRPQRRRQDQRAQLHQRHLSRRGAHPLPRRRHLRPVAARRSPGSASRAPSSTASCSRT